MSSSTNPLHVVELECKAQQYEWGKKGNDSSVAILLSGNGISTDSKQPYAELWMGTHPTAPSYIKSNNNDNPNKQLLRDYLQCDLPYLFKVLSIRTALSIQAHPDINLAKQLHKENPKEYKDANHKPELACAVTKFEAMCGFRPAKHILTYLHTVPELAPIIGGDNIKKFELAVNSSDNEAVKSSLKSIFAALMTVDINVFKTQLHSLLDRINNSNNQLTDPNQTQSNQLNIYELILRLNTQYPNDIGIFAPFLLNVFYCNPGESVFLAANEPHAYISGDIIEVMACSDNVVRAGLTPKFRDVNNLVNMLTYRTGNPNITTGQSIDNSTTLYSAPVPEFSLRKYVLNKDSNSNCNLQSLKSHSILLIYQGSGSITENNNKISVKMGSVVLIPANQNVTLETSDLQLIAFRCSANDDYKA